MKIEWQWPSVGLSVGGWYSIGCIISLTFIFCLWLENGREKKYSRRIRANRKQTFVSNINKCTPKKQQQQQQQQTCCERIHGNQTLNVPRPESI